MAKINKCKALAIKILSSSSKPLTVNEIWEEAEKSQMTKELTSTLKDPKHSIADLLYKDSKQINATFLATEDNPAKFLLKDNKEYLDNLNSSHKYTYSQLAEEILANSKNPMTPNDIWEEGERLKLIEKLTTKGQKSSAVLNMVMHDYAQRQNSFIKVGEKPARFALLSNNEASIAPTTQKVEEKTSKLKDYSYHERDIHPLLAHFAFHNKSFNRGKKIYTKTIYHEISKKGLNQWLHPDMVGFYSPINEWSDKLLEFNKATGETPIRLFSFELKKRIDSSNYRECFFQAVSNSSWANEGYLVAASLDENDNQLQEELERLALSFGIGVILLNIENIASSKVLFQARPKDRLDWETMNKLCKNNKDFAAFLKNVRLDHEGKQIHASEYDDADMDIEEYIGNKLSTQA